MGNERSLTGMVLVNDTPERRNEAPEALGAAVRRPDHEEVAQGIAALRHAIDLAAQADNVTFLEMNRWRHTLKGLEASVGTLQ